MLTEAHYPSKWSVALVFFVIMLLIAGVFAWAFYFNMGTLIISADRDFELEINGEVNSCLEASCQLQLPPTVYEATVSAEGYYDEVFYVEIVRWKEFSKDLKLSLVPYLQDISSSDLPAPIAGKAFFKKSAEGDQALYLRENGDEKLVASFESLKDPKVQAAGNTAIVIDDGRIFFVDLVEGRKLRRFDDSVEIIDALMSDAGKRVLLFVKMQDLEQLWVWYDETNELMPLSWYEMPEYVKWESGTDHRLYVLSDKLTDETDENLIGELIDSIETEEEKLTLFKYNLDTEKARKINIFAGVLPSELIKTDERYFVRFEGDVYQELVVE